MLILLRLAYPLMITANSSAFAKEKRLQLEASQKFAEFSVLKSGYPVKHRFKVSPKYAPTANNIRLFEHAIEGYGYDKIECGTHEVFAKSPTHATHPKTVLAASHLPQVNKS